MLDWGMDVGSIFHGYMCIVLYMKCIWCNGFPEISAPLEEGSGQTPIGICALCSIYLKLMWCKGFTKIYAQGSHQSGKSGKNLTIFSSQGNQGKTGVFRHNQGKVCQSGNFFQPAKIVFANHVFFSFGRVRLSGFLSMSGTGLSCI